MTYPTGTGSATTTVDTNVFIVQIKCADCATTTVPTAHNYLVPATAAGSNTNVELCATYFTCTSNLAKCPFTYDLRKGTSTWWGTFLAINTGTGQTSVNTNQVGNENVKCRGTHASGNYETNEFNVQNVCNTLTATPNVPSPNIVYIPAVPTGTFTNVVAGGSYYNMIS